MPKLSKKDRHFARRFSGGLNPALAREIDKAGGGKAWFVDQLDPDSVKDPVGNDVDTWFPSLQRSPRQIFQRNVDEVEGVWEVVADLSRWTVVRRIQSKRQVFEQMVDFWSNLLHVPLGDDEAGFYRVSYDKTIRNYALTSFEDLLQHTIVHPAMGLYLDNAVSTKEQPNENLGRELLELHSVGVDGGYTEDDVKESSRLLTGYRVDVWWPEFQALYDKSWHYTGRIDVMDFTHANTSTDGRAATKAFLTYLAQHPATANRIARRLCQRFVSDEPSEAIVTAVAKAYKASKSRVRPTMLAMVEHPDFLGSSGRKIRTPIEDYIATARALRVKVKQPTSGDSYAKSMYWSYGELGNPPYEWPAPNGYPEAGAAWTSAGRVLSSLDLHGAMAGGWPFDNQAVDRAPEAWLPDLPATLGDVIDHMGKELHTQKITAAVREGVAASIGLSTSKTVTSGDLWEWRIRTMLGSLLDAPIHLYR